jgi:hypothetical protein
VRWLALFVWDADKRLTVINKLQQLQIYKISMCLFCRNMQQCVVDLGNCLLAWLLRSLLFWFCRSGDFPINVVRPVSHRENEKKPETTMIHIHHICKVSWKSTYTLHSEIIMGGTSVVLYYVGHKETNVFNRNQAKWRDVTCRLKKKYGIPWWEKQSCIMDRWTYDPTFSSLASEIGMIVMN